MYLWLFSFPTIFVFFWQYWSTVLQDVAISFLGECSLLRDDCYHVGEFSLRINQNLLYLEKKMLENFPGKVVRSWYLQIGTRIRDYNDFEQHFSKDIKDFAQMTWPQTEFMACAAAQLSLYRAKSNFSWKAKQVWISLGRRRHRRHNNT